MELIGRLFNHVCQWGKDCFFPVECLLCGQGDTLLCPSCFRKIPFSPENLCLMCGASADNFGLCLSCKKSSDLDGIFTMWRYSQPEVKKIIESYKFNFVEELANFFACGLMNKLFCCVLLTELTQLVFLPIPLARKRYLERGFNQSQLIVQALNDIMPIEFYNDILKRIKNTKQQAKLNKQDRLVNVEDAFFCSALEIKNKNIVLIDDVFTSGATCQAAAKVLKDAGSGKVFALTIAHG